jgi:hypothetical protein
MSTPNFCEIKGIGFVIQKADVLYPKRETFWGIKGKYFGMQKVCFLFIKVCISDFKDASQAAG